MIYESAVVGVFNYLWGYRDAIDKKKPSMPFLTNAQNPLDELIGDMFGNCEGRFFLIEFKAERAGFFDEVHGRKSKIARTMLYRHLRNDFSCRKLALFGHFAGWSNGTIQIAPYAHTVGPGSLVGNKYHELDSKRWEWGFDRFYEHITWPDVRKSVFDDEFYGDGLGIPANSMLAYLECVLAGFPNVVSPTDEANAIFGFVSNNANSVVLVPTSVEGLLISLTRVKNLTQKSTKNTFQGFLPP